MSSMSESDKLRRVPARKHYRDAWDIMRLRLPPGTFARIAAHTRERTEFIRTAVERELQRREGELASKKKPKR